jgi:hypothetical protein
MDRLKVWTEKISDRVRQTAFEAGKVLVRQHWLGRALADIQHGHAMILA